MAWSMTPRACAATSQNPHPNASKSSLYRRDRGLKLKQKSLIICASDLPSHWICMYIASFIFPFFKIKKAQTYFIWYEERKVSSIHMQYSDNNLAYQENFTRALGSSPPPPTTPYSSLETLPASQKWGLRLFRRGQKLLLRETRYCRFL